MRPPGPARLLGLAGLLPQLAAVAVLLSRDPDLRFAAIALGYAYGALILSFLGGLWWGLAARAEPAPAWLWVAAVAPSLVAVGSAVPWAVGGEWPGPSLVILGAALIAALGVDRRLQTIGIAPPWWLALRIPLSVGLGTLTIVIALL